MNPDELDKLVTQKIESYLAGEMTAQAVSDWAQDIITGDEWENLPPATTQAIHALFDLHDEGKAWCPSKNDLIQYKHTLTKSPITQTSSR